MHNPKHILRRWKGYEQADGRVLCKDCTAHYGADDTFQVELYEYEPNPICDRCGVLLERDD